VGVYKISVLPIGQYRLTVELIRIQTWVGTFAGWPQDMVVNRSSEVGELSATVEVRVHRR